MPPSSWRVSLPSPSEGCRCSAMASASPRSSSRSRALRRCRSPSRCASSLAQYEYQNVAHGNLERTLRERRAFLEYAIRGHVDHVSLAANPPTLMRFALSARQPAELGAARQELVAAARDLIDSGFSGWRYELDGHEPIVAGSFLRAPALP